MGNPLGLEDGISIFWEGTKAMSPARFRTYIQGSESRSMTLARHAWNIALCQNLFPALHACELTFRNAIHIALSDRYDTRRWMIGPVVLNDYHQGIVNSAVAKIGLAGGTITASSIVAQLSFGFWVQLLYKEYKDSIADPVLKRSFQHAPEEVRTRQALDDAYSDILELRNRAFHLEPIWNRPALADECRDIWAAVRWLNPGYAALAKLDCKFQQVLGAGPEPYRIQTEALIQKKVDAMNAKTAS